MELGCKEGRDVRVQQDQQGWSFIPALWPRWRIPRGFLAKNPTWLLVFGINPCVIHSGCVCVGILGWPRCGRARGGCSSARFVTPCVFSPLSPLVPAPLQVPSAPRYLRIRQPNLEIINLEWDHPEHPNGIITGYTLQYTPCTCRVFLPRINREILPFLLFARSMRNWRLPWWDKMVLGGVLAICRGW